VLGVIKFTDNFYCGRMNLQIIGTTISFGAPQQQHCPTSFNHLHLATGGMPLVFLLNLLIILNYSSAGQETIEATFPHLHFSIPRVVEFDSSQPDSRKVTEPDSLTRWNLKLTIGQSNSFQLKWQRRCRGRGIQDLRVQTLISSRYIPQTYPSTLD
jgi:hypothetical protein